MRTVIIFITTFMFELYLFAISRQKHKDERGESMKTRTFSKYESACSFRDKVDGQIEWCKYKGKPYWIVWYEE